MTAEQQKWADEYLARNPHHRVIDKGRCLVILPKDTTVCEQWRQMRHEKKAVLFNDFLSCRR